MRFSMSASRILLQVAYVVLLLALWAQFIDSFAVINSVSISEVGETPMLINIGLIFNFIGIILLLYYSEKTADAVGQGNKDHLCNSNWYRGGYGLLALGFLLQIVSNFIN